MVRTDGVRMEEEEWKREEKREGGTRREGDKERREHLVRTRRKEKDPTQVIFLLSGGILEFNPSDYCDLCNCL